MGVPWFRMIMMIVMLSSDDVEGALANVAHVLLGWSLRELFHILQQVIIVPKLVRAGRVHPEVWRRAKFPWTAVCFHLACSGGVQWGLHKAGRARLGYFLIITTGALPVFKCLTYPRVWPMVPFVAWVLYATWYFEGAQELFVGLALFQGVATAQETRAYYFGPSATWSFAIWLVAFAASFPIVVIFGAAYFYSHKFERFIRRRKKPEYETLWSYFERYARALGYSDEEGEDPFRVLGVGRHATSSQVRKRYRDLSMRYHPDKTGNDPSKKELFLKIQKAMEMITNGVADDARPAREQAVRDRVFATIARCGSLWTIVAIWIVISIGHGVVHLAKRRADDESGAADGREPMTVGPSFVGANIFGFNRHRPRPRGVENLNAGGARVVGNRRVTAPSGPAPVIDADADEIETTADDDASPKTSTNDGRTS